MPRQLPQGQLPCGDGTLRTPNHEQTARGAHRLCGRARRGGVHLQEQTSRSSVPSRFSKPSQSQGFHQWKPDFHAARGAARAEVKPDTPRPGRGLPALGFSNSDSRVVKRALDNFSLQLSRSWQRRVSQSAVWGGFLFTQRPRGRNTGCKRRATSKHTVSAHEGAQCAAEARGSRARRSFRVPGQHQAPRARARARPRAGSPGDTASRRPVRGPHVVFVYVRLTGMPEAR